MRNPSLRTLAAAAAALVLLLCTAGPASADTVSTTTGQKLSIEVTGILATGRVVGQGTATISSGPTTIASVLVSFDDHEEIPVTPDAQGRFEVNAPWPDATSVTVRAKATASDGTIATSVAQGRTQTQSREPADKPVRHRHLADTGAPGPRVLGPLGLLLVLAGLRLVTWSREDEHPEDVA